MWKRLLIAVLLVTLCAVPPILAKPSQDLSRYLSELEELHDGKCTVHKVVLVPTECLVLWSREHQTIFVLLYTDTIELVRILAVPLGKEPFEVWKRDDSV